MPKIGAEADDRLYNVRCRVCGCLTEKLVSRFGWDGKPAAHAYRCANPFHNCGTVEREGCEPKRVYEALKHAYWDGAGGSWEHPGTLDDCEMPECADRKDRHRAGLSPSGVWHPGSYADCFEPTCEPPF
jgi:hypothetical protein